MKELKDKILGSKLTTYQLKSFADNYEIKVHRSGIKEALVESLVDGIKNDEELIKKIKKLINNFQYAYQCSVCYFPLNQKISVSEFHKKCKKGKKLKIGTKEFKVHKFGAETVSGDVFIEFKYPGPEESFTDYYGELVRYSRTRYAKCILRNTATKSILEVDIASSHSTELAEAVCILSDTMEKPTKKNLSLVYTNIKDALEAECEMWKVIGAGKGSHYQSAEVAADSKDLEEDEKTNELFDGYRDHKKGLRFEVQHAKCITEICRIDVNFKTNQIIFTKPSSLKAHKKVFNLVFP